MLSSRPVPLSIDGYGVSYARTPGKALLKHRPTLQENAVHHGSMTIKGKGKSGILQTPFRPGAHGKKGIQTAGKPTVTVTRPLGDKTPFPNRQIQPLQTPAPQAAKIAKLALLEDPLLETPGNLLLPSARRKSLRLPRSASKNFKTPVTQGNHWDVSDGDLEVELNAGAAEQEEVQLPDYDEIEYMPPKVPEQPYEPLFEMPDYKILGQALMNIAHNGICDDTLDKYYSADIETQVDFDQLYKDCSVFMRYDPTLPELVDDDDPFEFRCPPPPHSASIQDAKLRISTVPGAPRPRSAASASSSRLARQPTAGTSTATSSTTRTTQVTNAKPSTVGVRAMSKTSTIVAPSRTGTSTAVRSPTGTGSSTVPMQRPATSIGVRAPLTRKAPSPSEPPRASSATDSAPTMLRRTPSAQTGTTSVVTRSSSTSSSSRIPPATSAPTTKGPMTRSRSAAANSLWAPVAVTDGKHGSRMGARVAASAAATKANTQPTSLAAAVRGNGGANDPLLIFDEHTFDDENDDFLFDV